MAIERLNQGTPTLAASVPFYDPTKGADRRASLTEILELLQEQSVGAMQTQYSAPNATGFSVTISPTVTGGSVWLLLTPAAGYAAGTIVLPASALDGQEILVSCTQAVTTLTVSGNGHTVNGAPTALAANSFFRLRYDGVFAAWYRVG